MESSIATCLEDQLSGRGHCYGWGLVHEREVLLDLVRMHAGVHEHALQAIVREEVERVVNEWGVREREETLLRPRLQRRVQRRECKSERDRTELTRGRSAVRGANLSS